MRFLSYRRMRRFLAEQSGTTMVEFAVCIALFLLILFAVIDFARLGYTWVTAEKAMQRAVRIASVRPAICNGLPLYHRRDVGTADEYPAGTLCRQDGGVCQQINVSCLLTDTAWDTTGAAGIAAQEIWDPTAATWDGWPGISNLLPQGTTMSNVRISYNYDRNLGFVGGPYVPLVTMSLQGTANTCGTQTRRLPDGTTVTENALCFEFVTPLSALASTAGAANATQINGDDDVTAVGARIPLPAISVTLPAEDLNQGTNG